ncbi:formyltransferase family protein [Leucothrix arctica]|uniref:Formyl transferase N-terminal domain-containing protein n=1 Tax=Leucothrix arctica TaxID=1481894 RepID=A0A317C922_9GAMM|nr:formyltransferase family protein [Leucothrix arctica]PWQ95008.1 hypothetical protein DKT75_13825 [Leucothrix arctica]
MNKQKRVVFCTYPSLYSSIVLTEILSAPNIEVAAIIVSTRNLKAKENKLISDIKRISISGVQYALYLLMVTQGYRLFPALSKHGSISSISKKNHIPLILTADINSKTVQDKIKKIDPDIIFCAHFNQLVHPSTYTLAQEAAINLHPSLLPDLKGVDPAFYALTESYNETGVTLHHLAEGFDTGAVITQKYQEITLTDTLLSLNTKLFSVGAKLFVSVLSNRVEHPSTTVKKELSRYDSWPSRAQVKQFKQYRKFGFLRFLFR